MYKFEECINCQCASCARYQKTCWGNCIFCVDSFSDPSINPPSSFFKKEDPQCKEFEEKLPSNEKLLMQMNSILKLCAEQLVVLTQTLKRIQADANKGFVLLPNKENIYKIILVSK